MNIKNLTLILILVLASCQHSNKLPEKYKIGLLGFSVNKSSVTRKMENGNSLEFGALWAGFNKINIKPNNDTLIADVNIELSTSLNYDGGYELVRDTLFLYAKCLDKEQKTETLHSTLTYKINPNGLKYKEIEFKEIK